MTENIPPNAAGAAPIGTVGDVVRCLVRRSGGVGDLCLRWPVDTGCLVGSFSASSPCVIPLMDEVSKLLLNRLSASSTCAVVGGYGSGEARVLLEWV